MNGCARVGGDGGSVKLFGMDTSLLLFGEFLFQFPVLKFELPDIFADAGGVDSRCVLHGYSVLVMEND